MVAVLAVLEVVVVDVALVHAGVSGKRYYHALHSVTDKRNLVVQIPVAENCCLVSTDRRLDFAVVSKGTKQRQVQRIQ